MKFPQEAKQVFKGVIFDVYQWQQKMFDGSYETFEGIRRANTIEIIAVCDDKVYLTYQSQPTKHNFYSLLGGRAEEGEEPLTTAKRELLEESGFESDDWELYKECEPFHKMEWKVYTYIARNCRKVADQKLDAGEKIEVVGKSFDEFVKIILSETYWGKELVIDLLRRKVNGTLEDFKKKLFNHE